MRARRFLRGSALVAILWTVAGCRDAVTPLDGPQLAGSAPTMLGEMTSLPTDAEGMHILQQGAAAPALETYQVSFWARKDRASTVVVNYTTGEPFLRFDIPRDGLKRGPGDNDDDDRKLRKHDSLLITLTIDPRTFTVDFQPSGVVFDKHHRATLAMWYENANPDLNGDGVVDATDYALTQQLAIWTRHAKRAPWMKLASGDGAFLPFVWTELRHFSQYAVSW